MGLDEDIEHELSIHDMGRVHKLWFVVWEGKKGGIVHYHLSSFWYRVNKRIRDWMVLLLHRKRVAERSKDFGSTIYNSYPPNTACMEIPMNLAILHLRRIDGQAYC